MTVALLDRPDVQRLMTRELARRELAEFCMLLDPFYEPASHTSLLCAELEAVDRGDNDRLIVMMPPRHSKTWHTSIHFPAWSMGRNPRQQMILASYSADLAWENSGKARDLFKHPLWPFRTRLHEDKQSEHRWRTDTGGVLVAAGVGGPATGFGAHKLVIDDFVKNRQDADSETVRESQWGWYTSTARTRLMPGGAIVITATHWHEADLIGRILNGPGAARWRVVSLPAIAEDEDDALGRHTGEALWPAWYDVAALDDIRQDIGSRDWSSLYQQRPTADEGGMFKRAWFSRRWDQDEPPKTTYTVTAVDAAYKTGVAHDYSAIATWGTDGTDLYLLRLRRGRWEFPELKRQILASQEHDPSNVVLIEDTAAGQSAIQELSHATMLPIVPVKVTASKEARAQAVSPLCEAGKVVLPKDAWVSEWIDEHASFPTGRHDDMVDTTSMALAYLRPVGRPTTSGSRPLVRGTPTPNLARKFAVQQERLAKTTPSLVRPMRRG